MQNFDEDEELPYVGNWFQQTYYTTTGMYKVLWKLDSIKKVECDCEECDARNMERDLQEAGD